MFNLLHVCCHLVCETCYDHVAISRANQERPWHVCQSDQFREIGSPVSGHLTAVSKYKKVGFWSEIGQRGSTIRMSAKYDVRAIKLEKFFLKNCQIVCMPLSHAVCIYGGWSINYPKSNDPTCRV